MRPYHSPQYRAKAETDRGVKMTVPNRAVPYILTVLAAGVSALYAYEPVEAGRQTAPVEAVAAAVDKQPDTETCPRSAWPYVEARCLEAVGNVQARSTVRVVVTDREAERLRRGRLKEAVRGI